MTTEWITPGDIVAMADVLDRLVEQSDSLSVGAALGLIAPLNALIASARRAESLVETQAKAMLEGAPRTIGNKVWAATPTGKWRPNQAKLKTQVFLYITHDPKTGAKRTKLTIANAVDATIDMMYKLFVAPSAMPKQGGLDELGLERKQFCDWQVTGTELKSMDIGGEDE